MTETRGAPARLAPIDGLRAVSAFLVLVHHCSYMAGTTNGSGWGEVLGRFDIGVSIFFAISGFLLFRQMALAIVDGAPLPSATAFWRRRFWRIAPSYWVALTVLASVGAVTLGSAREVALHYSLTQVYHPFSVLNGITQSWSLATEVAFYLCLPVLAVVLVRAVRGSSPESRARNLVVAVVALWVLAVPVRLAMEKWADFDTVSQELWLTGQSNHFIGGMVLAAVSVWSTRSAGVGRLSGVAARWSALWLVVAGVLFVIVARHLGLTFGLTRASLWREFARNEIYGAVAVCLLLPLALGPTESSAYHRVLSLRPVVHLGRISYGIYLWHMMLLSSNGPSRWMPWEPGDGRLWVRIVVVSAVTVLVASFNFSFVEEPLARRMSLRPRGRQAP